MHDFLEPLKKLQNSGYLTNLGESGVGSSKLLLTPPSDGFITHIKINPCRLDYNENLLRGFMAKSVTNNLKLLKKNKENL